MILDFSVTTFGSIRFFYIVIIGFPGHLGTKGSWLANILDSASKGGFGSR